MRTQRREITPINRLRPSWLMVSVVFLLMLLGMVMYVDPEILEGVLIPGSYSPFLTVLFACSVTVLIGFGVKVWRALLWGSSLLLFLILSMMRMGHILNGLLIISLLITFEYIPKRIK